MTTIPDNQVKPFKTIALVGLDWPKNINKFVIIISASLYLAYSHHYQTAKYHKPKCKIDHTTLSLEVQDYTDNTLFNNAQSTRQTNVSINVHLHTLLITIMYIRLAYLEQPQWSLRKHNTSQSNPFSCLQLGKFHL